MDMDALWNLLISGLGKSTGEGICSFSACTESAPILNGGLMDR